jgi:predicted GIY-YIG superfamily endonuclease
LSGTWLYGQPCTEKWLKEWQRKWKLALIEISNPQWTDLYDEITGSRG